MRTQLTYRQKDSRQPTDDGRVADSGREADRKGARKGDRKGGGREPGSEEEEVRRVRRK